MVQACAVICITYVHARALTHGVQALQDLDVGRIIGFGFYGHSAFLSQSENYTRFGRSKGYEYRRNKRIAPIMFQLASPLFLVPRGTIGLDRVPLPALIHPPPGGAGGARPGGGGGAGAGGEGGQPT